MQWYFIIYASLNEILPVKIGWPAIFSITANSMKMSRNDSLRMRRNALNYHFIKYFIQSLYRQNASTWLAFIAMSKSLMSLPFRGGGGMTSMGYLKLHLSRLFWQTSVSCCIDTGGVYVVPAIHERNTLKKKKPQNEDDVSMWRCCVIESLALSCNLTLDNGRQKCTCVASTLQQMVRKGNNIKLGSTSNRKGTFKSQSPCFKILHVANIANLHFSFISKFQVTHLFLY